MSQSLRQLLGQKKAIVAPGVGDALGARLVEEAGFPALSVSGYYLAATMGCPDVGLVTMSELVERTRHICAAVDLPVIADADNGYGNAINVTRTVRELEAAGAAAIVLEDQVLPKKCGGAPGIALVSAEEMCGKLRAALDARKRESTLIVARTDGFYSPGGLGEAVRRVRMYREAGADMLFAHGLSTIDELERYRAGVEGPLMVGVGTKMDMPIAKLEQLGYQVMIYSLSLLRAAIVAMRRTLAELHTSGSLDHASPAMISVPELHRFTGLEAVRRLEERYAK